MPQMDLAMLKNAPHPNAARLFIQHFLEHRVPIALRQCLDAAGGGGRLRSAPIRMRSPLPTPR